MQRLFLLCNLMAEYSVYPTALDVEVLLKSATYWPVGADDSPKVLFAREQAQTTIDGAISEFEDRTSQKPFLADISDETDVFDGTDGNGYLDFRASAVSITGVSVRGLAYTQSTQWWPYPANARRKKEPFTGIQFNSAIHPRPGQIAVTARWGYAATLPAAAWLAIMRLAAAQTLGQIENAQGVASLSQDGFSKAFDVVGIVSAKDLLQELTKRFDRIVEVYTRVTA
jgi:hypothetical protein